MMSISRHHASWDHTRNCYLVTARFCVQTCKRPAPSSPELYVRTPCSSAILTSRKVQCGRRTKNAHCVGDIMAAEQRPLTDKT